MIPLALGHSALGSRPSSAPAGRSVTSGAERPEVSTSRSIGGEMSTPLPKPIPNESLELPVEEVVRMRDTTSWLPSILIRLACGLASAAIVIFGSLIAGLTLNLLTAVLLIPTLVFVAGVRTPRLVWIFGGLLVGTTALSWGLFLANRHASTGGINVVMGSLFTLAASVFGACAELVGLGSSEVSDSRQAARETKEADDPSDSQPDYGRTPPRAW